MTPPPELIAAKEAVEAVVFALPEVTGIDVGVRDEEQPDADDLVVRVFVQDLGAVPELPGDAQGFPIVVLQRSFRPAGLPDTAMYRPVVGGVSVMNERWLHAGRAGGSSGTLGAVVRHRIEPGWYGLGNHHVLCGDLNRAQGQEILQPETFFGARHDGDHLGVLSNWAFPETTKSGRVDAALCAIDVDAAQEIAELGATAGPNYLLVPGDIVHKRGRTTGLTHGWVSGTNGSHKVPYPDLPPVAPPPLVPGFPPDRPADILRYMTGQIQVHVDFPQSITFLESGDSGSVLLDPDNRIAGLLYASGDWDNDPAAPTYALANPIADVEDQLNISV
ncbi:hypothetical protein [Amycolatopsis vastitatis]|uniref:Serine protease n=1 Tax=Amycolatopsis vastitatis TaxID=1905142 RepID=A0A229TF90_9PSEU|nr:hypothetical protein [Amycolatopsis vastitatis]OXM69803.1 hypothetical protein CF165_09910 [Amycolatopsis vastitatis]